MSHQDRGRSKQFRTNSQDVVTALAKLAAEDAFESVVFGKLCSWKPSRLVVAAILMALSDHGALTDNFDEARRIVVDATGEKPAGSFQAFMKLLFRWSPQLLDAVKTRLRWWMQTKLSPSNEFGGWNVFGGDGSRIETPRTVANEREFAAEPKGRDKPSSKAQPPVKQRSRPKAKSEPKPTRKAKSTPTPPQKRRAKERHAAKAQKADKRARRRAKQSGKQAAAQARQDRKEAADAKKSTTPQIWLTVLWHASTGLLWDWRRGRTGSSERDHVREMIGSLPPGALLTADAGFVGYSLWRTLFDAGNSFVIRVGANVRLLRKLGYHYDRQADVVYLWPDEIAAKEHPPLVLRLVKVQTAKTVIYLVTNVFDRDRLSDELVARIYKRRWGVELFYRSFKVTFERRKLRSRSPQNALLELDWSLVGLWALCAYAQYVLVQQGVAPNRLSVAAALRAVRRPMRQYRSPAEPGRDLQTLLAKAVKDDYHRSGSKESRDYPRKKRHHSTGAPKFQAASNAQRKQARRHQPRLFEAAPPAA